MQKTALIGGGVIAIVGIMGIVMPGGGLFPPDDGALAVTGAILLAAGLISNAIGMRTSD